MLSLLVTRLQSFQPQMMNDVVLGAYDFLPLLGTVAVALAVLSGTNLVLRKRWHGTPERQFHFQLIMLALTLASLLALVVALPISDTLRGQFLSLIGILLSASIALSSTTFIGNILAGFMLRSAGKARPGDFITVAETTGRISEMNFLQTEIQTEFRDLVTVPNIYMVTQPLKVVRASGSIITAEVTLGYDVPQRQASELLRSAAESSGLRDCFVHLRSLGDFSVTYRVAGLLEDIQSLISARSALLAAMLDALHGAGIEIVSPNVMSTRSLPPDHQILPERSRPRPRPRGSAQVNAEDIAFDKAEEAASVEKLTQSIRTINDELAALAQESSDDAATRQRRLEGQKAELKVLLAAAAERIEANET